MTSRTGPYSKSVRAVRTVVLAVVLAALFAACGTGISPYEAISTAAAPAGVSSAIPPEATSSTTPPSTTAPAPETTAAPPSTQPPSGSGGSSGVPVLAPPTTAAGVQRMLAQAGSARQVLVVNAPSSSVSTATLTAFQRSGTGWTTVFGPWPARIGSAGFAPPGEKREGDGRTPSGAYGFDFFFGVDPDPGVKFAYRVVTQSIVWVDDPASPLYNQWVDRSRQTVNAHVEQMYQPQAYRHGAVIAYNAERTPNLGSAIFLHASTGAATAGCVSLPVDQLVQVLKWLDPAESPRIIMGVG